MPSPTPHNNSVKVVGDGPVVAERPLYFKTSLAGGVDGGTDIVGAQASASTFLLAPGTTLFPYTTLFRSQNPGPAPTTAHLFFQGADDVGVPVPVAPFDVPV